MHAAAAQRNATSRKTQATAAVEADARRAFRVTPVECPAERHTAARRTQQRPAPQRSDDVSDVEWVARIEPRAESRDETARPWSLVSDPLLTEIAKVNTALRVLTRMSTSDLPCSALRCLERVSRAWSFLDSTPPVLLVFARDANANRGRLVIRRGPRYRRA
jgi:hypothetical protein